jgi:hypothetical protein
MSELDNLEQELNTNLAALDKPCGCSETSENPFAAESFSASDDLASELETALGNLGDDAGFGQQLSAEEAMEFASVANTSSITLEDIVSFVEQNPGLKITFSH